MEIKIPKTVNIREHVFTVETNKGVSGAWFDISSSTIGIGTLNIKSNPGYTFMLISHEVSEIIHCLLGTRYNDYSSEDNYKFFMDHKEFENHTALFSSVIQNFIK